MRCHSTVRSNPLRLPRQKTEQHQGNLEASWAWAGSFLLEKSFKHFASLLKCSGRTGIQTWFWVLIHQKLPSSSFETWPRRHFISSNRHVFSLSLHLCLSFPLHLSPPADSLLTCSMEQLPSVMQKLAGGLFLLPLKCGCFMACKSQLPSSRAPCCREWWCLTARKTCCASESPIWSWQALLFTRPYRWVTQTSRRDLPSKNNMFAFVSAHLFYSNEMFKAWRHTTFTSCPTEAVQRRSSGGSAVRLSVRRLNSFQEH